MEPPYIRTGTDADAEAYGKLSGHWNVASLHQAIGWTEKPITIEYAGQTLLLLPEDAKHLPAIATRGDPDTSRRLILEFSSALAWSR